MAEDMISRHTAHAQGTTSRVSAYGNQLIVNAGWPAALEEIRGLLTELDSSAGTIAHPVVRQFLGTRSAVRAVIRRRSYPSPAPAVFVIGEIRVMATRPRVYSSAAHAGKTTACGRITAKRRLSSADSKPDSRYRSQPYTTDAYGRVIEGTQYCNVTQGLRTVRLNGEMADLPWCNNDSVNAATIGSLMCSKPRQSSQRASANGFHRWRYW